MQNNIQKAAILLIEFQNQWLKPGLYNRLIKKELARRNVVQNTIKLVSAARSSGWNIIHAPLIIDPDHKKGWLAHLTRGRVFTKDTWKAELADGLYDAVDIIVKGRYNFNAFDGSDLEEILSNLSIKNLYCCGFITDQCVVKTMRAAIKKQFNAVMVSECTATWSSRAQKKSEARFPGRVVRVGEVLETMAAEKTGKR